MAKRVEYFMPVKDFGIQSHNASVWQFFIVIIITKIIMVNNITVLMKRNGKSIL